jgi:hypothetical protein
MWRRSWRSRQIGTASQLMGISDEAYTAGLHRLEQDAIRESDAPGTPFTSEFVVVTIAGDKGRD